MGWRLLLLMTSMYFTDCCKRISPSSDNYFSASNNEFGLKLYQKLATKRQNNVIISPLSVATALSMTSLGAKGESLKQFEKLLNLTDSVHDQYNRTIDSLYGEKDLVFKMANAVWIDDSSEVLGSFEKNIAKSYSSQSNRLQFKKAEKAREIINKWVSEKTDNKIPELLPSNSISAATRLVLTNAVYFKGLWKIRFNSTERMEFHSLNGEKKQVEFLLVKSAFKAGFNPAYNVRVLELPYTNNLSMYILMPKNAKEFSKFERDLNASTLRYILDNTQKPTQPFQVAIPKFEISFNSKLNDKLKEMGLTDVFDESKSDLSAIDGARGLYISGVYHQGFIGIDKDGTEASAASGVVANWRSMPPQPFTANQPFIFIIRDNFNALNLFIGRYVKP
ncbi:leukocyte elastase inhibitor-like [Tubulanus polymorphus]|uniref:leukocyte elastase inhibitor-like n=1 Tax=Tubulanus polymorphus TaxID=672921 RepID=UPI003DA39730